MGKARTNTIMEIYLSVSGRTVNQMGMEIFTLPMAINTKANGRITNITGGVPLCIHWRKLLQECGKILNF
jgi:hypothetical protein